MVFIAFWCKYIEGVVKLGREHTEFKWIILDDAIEESTLDISIKDSNEFSSSKCIYLKISFYDRSGVSLISHHFGSLLLWHRCGTHWNS